MFTTDQFTEYCIDQSRKVRTPMNTYTVTFTRGNGHDGYTMAIESIDAESIDDAGDFAERYARGTFLSDDAALIYDADWSDEYHGCIDAEFTNDLVAYAKKLHHDIDGCTIDIASWMQSHLHSDYVDLNKVTIRELPNVINRILERVMDECMYAEYIQWHIAMD